MNQTFKHVAIFVIFLVCAIFLDLLQHHLTGYFDFRFGVTVLMLLWSVTIIIVFNLLFHYFGKWPEKVSYICSIVAIIAVLLLAHFKAIDINDSTSPFLFF